MRRHIEGFTASVRGVALAQGGQMLALAEKELVTFRPTNA